MPLSRSVISGGSCAAPGSRICRRKFSNPIPLSSIFSEVRTSIGPPAPLPLVLEPTKARSKRLNRAASILMPRPSMLPMVSDTRLDRSRKVTFPARSAIAPPPARSLSPPINLIILCCQNLQHLYSLNLILWA